MKKWMSMVAVLFTAVMTIAGCSSPDSSTSPGNPLPPPWESAFGADHPLAGLIWQPGLGRYVQPDMVRDIIGAADFVMLGEKHDNPDHHHLQAWLIQALFEHGPVAPVAFEMITTDKSDQLEKYQIDHPGDATGLGPYLEWEKSGWPDWSLYQPVFQVAMASGAPLVAASQPRHLFRQMVKTSVKTVLGDDVYAGLGLDQKIPPVILAAKRREIVDSHCNMLPGPMVDPMVRVQQAKDANMAHILIDNDIKSGGSGGILVAGAGHVRNDYGVPWHLRRAAADKSVVSIAMIEVAADLTDPRQYAAGIGAEKQAFDFLWFTLRSDNEDPCERYSQQLKKMGKKK